MGKRKKKYTKDGFFHTREVPLQILASAYPQRCTLLKYLQSNDPQKSLCLFDESTSPELKHLLTTSIVACGLEKSLVISDQGKISYTKDFSLSDIVDRVISVICHGKGDSDKHVLSQGYHNIPCGVPELIKLQCLFPNSMVSYVKSRLWNELHNRIGNDLMMYMLKNLSVFVKTKSSCYFQVSGCPIDAVVPRKVSATCLSRKAKKKTRPTREKDRREQHKSVHPDLKSVILTQQNCSICRHENGHHNSKTDSGSGPRAQRTAPITKSCSDTGKTIGGNSCCNLSTICVPSNCPTTSQSWSTNEMSGLSVGSTTVYLTSTTSSQKGEAASEVSLSLQNDGTQIPCTSNNTGNPDTLASTRGSISEKHTNVFLTTDCVKSDVASLPTKSNFTNPLISSTNFNSHNKRFHTEDDIMRHAYRLPDVQFFLPTTSSTRNIDRVCFSLSASQTGLEYNVHSKVNESPMFNTENDHTLQQIGHSVGVAMIEPCKNFSSSAGLSLWVNTFTHSVNTSVSANNQTTKLDDIEKELDKFIDETTPCQTVTTSAEPQLKKRRLNSSTGNDINISCVQSKPSNLLATNTSKRKHEDDQCRAKLKKYRKEMVENSILRDKVKKVSSNKRINKTKNDHHQIKPRRRKRKEKEKVTTASKIRLLNRNIFHSTGTERFCGKKHVMETIPANSRGACTLMRKIFLGTDPGTATKDCHSKEKKKKPKRLTKRLLQCKKVFLQFLARHKSCPFKYLLNYHCPDHYHAKKHKCHSRVKNSRKMRTKGSKKIEEETRKVKVKDVRYSKILSFCRSICKRVIPPSLWGSKRNMEAFLTNLWQFISLRKREKFSLQQIMKGIKVNDCEFLMTKQYRGLRLPASEFLARQKLLTEFYFWFMNSYIVPLLKNVFTITDSGASRNRVFYYRKSDWNSMSKTVVKRLSETLLDPITEDESKQLISSGKSLGYSLLRLIPKHNGVRPVVNMSLRNKNAFGRKSRSINQILKNAFHVLDYERKTFPSNLGSSNIGLDDIFTKLQPFAARHRAMEDSRPLYFVRLDVSNCYDSIKQDKLLEIIKDILSEDEYMIRRYCVLTLRKGHAIRKEYKRVVAPTDDCRQFPKFMVDTIENSNVRNAVIVDQVKYATVEKDEVVDTLKKHIFCNIIKMSRSYYRQKCGISQGSVISPLLCNYYLGHLENKEFPEILCDLNSLLLRWVDDFLLVTYSLDYAKKFLFSMIDGFPEYNCTIKAEKSLVNFEALTRTGDMVQRIPETALMFPWCSLLINMQTLEVQADYSRYEDKNAMMDSLTVDLVNHPGTSIFQKLKFALQSKCHPIFLDLGLNTKNTVLVNIYQSFLYTIQRFHAHATELPKGKQVKHNPEFFMDGLREVVTYYYNQVLRIIHESISRELILCLFAEAVLSVLRRKPARYTGLLEMVTRQRKQFPQNVQTKFIQKYCNTYTVKEGRIPPCYFANDVPTVSSDVPTNSGMIVSGKHGTP